MSIQRLIVFTRYPVAGKAKTRLIPTLGADGAAAAHKALAQRAVETALAWRADDPAARAVSVWFTGGSAAEMRAWLGEHAGLSYREQPSGDLGARMSAAFAAAAEAKERAVIIGTDCPALAPRHIAEAFDAGDRATSDSAINVALGPCSDGGYYLIGLTGADDAPAAIFADMPWGTDRVLSLTVERARAADVIVTLLSEELDDVDRPEDLHLLDTFKLR